METLQLLGVALGLATLAGLNLYLTVFVSGLAIQQGWITLHPQYEQLAVLADPWIVGVAGALFVLEFFADKIPWVDSLWDAVHTFIRPVGGALLSIAVLGEANPVYDVIVGLLGGSVALASHGVKAGTRLVANASPEPFSNIFLSLFEDLTVLGGLALVYFSPVTALVLVIVALGLSIWLAPRIFRAARSMLWFAWRRIHHVANPASTEPVVTLPIDLEIALHRDQGNPTLRWAAPCVTGKGPLARVNTFGWLLFTSNESLNFARLVGKEMRLDPLPTEGRKALHRTGFVCDKVVLYELPEGNKQTFQFDRSRREHARKLTELINSAAVANRAPVETVAA